MHWKSGIFRIPTLRAERFIRASAIGTRVIGLFIFCGILGCGRRDAGWRPAQSPLKTKWAGRVNPDRVHTEYPRPQMVRKAWMNLNGLWDFEVTHREGREPVVFSEKILVPFPVESALSGIGRRVDATERIWYRKTFLIPTQWRGERVLLHFGAVDWESVVFINGEEMGLHRGGYDGFTYDITDALHADGEQEILVSVWDPSNEGNQPVGKQSANPRGIWYTPSSGMWQTVWMEPVPETYIDSIRLIPDVDRGVLRLHVQTGGDRGSYRVQALAFESRNWAGGAEGRSGGEIVLDIPDAVLWSPDSPFLYDLRITLIDGKKNEIDRVESYFGMRKISIGNDENGVTRLLLNDRFLFQLGPLDQGFWPDGLYTAPCDDALKYDIEMLKEMGFNMARKHVKVEPDRWYTWCDRLGLLVWQDMPNGRNESKADRSQFESELERVILGRINHPSIVMWVPFNEGWGQYDSNRITRWIKKIDPSRLVNHASGWHDRGAGDVHDVHSYPDPRSPEPEKARAAVLGEFGGLGYNVPGHAWNPEGWGYDLLEDTEGLLARYENLYEQLFPLIEKPGLSAAVYTQVSDIESENNGLMTYDRKVLKIKPAELRNVHGGYLSPRVLSKAFIFVDQITVELFQSRDDAVIRYTLDKREPTIESSVYSGPFQLYETQTLKTRAFWEGETTSRTSTFTFRKVDPKASLPVEKSSAGLKVQYYEGSWDELPDFQTLTPVRSSVRKTIDMHLARRSEQYGLTFEGLINVPRTGVYVFYTTSDDGSRLLIGDELVVDNDGLHGSVERHGAVALERGAHPFRVEFFQKQGGQFFAVHYEGPGIEKQEIPAEVLKH